MNDCKDNELIELIKKNSKRCCKPCFGPTGATGPTGPTGPIGITETIAVGSTRTGAIGEEAKVIDRKLSHDHVFDFVIPMGPTGPTGPTGINKIKNAYIVTFNVGDTEVLVNQSSRLPLNRLELDIDNIVDLNVNENTIKFNQIGYYKISYIVSAMTQKSGATFDKNTDFVTIGFRLLNTDNIYIGSSKWIYNEDYNEISGQGVLAVDSTDNVYELVNLSPKEIYLSAPDVKNIESKSYFTNAIVNVVIEYMGR